MCALGHGSAGFCAVYSSAGCSLGLSRDICVVLVKPIHCLKWSVNALSSLPSAELCLFSLVDHFVSVRKSTWLLESWEERTFHTEVKRNLKV